VALVAAFVVICFVAPARSKVSSFRMLQDFYEDPWDNLEVRNNWEAYKLRFKKVYSTIEQEKAAFINWLTNVKSAQDDGEKSTWVGGETSLSDISQEEFRKVYLSLQIPDNERNVVRSQDQQQTVAAAASIDWREYNGRNYVTPIKNQGGCGSCWSFATIGALESLSMIKGGASQPDFSEQQLVSCTKGLANLYGCQGGWPTYAMNWVATNGITYESSFPYAGTDYDKSKCPNPNKVPLPISRGVDVTKGSVEALKNAVNMQPVVVCIDAGKWQGFRGGIFGAQDCTNSVNHAVLLIGYTSEYWIIKNSWGSWWGEQGFIRLAMGNSCGIADHASYPEYGSNSNLVDTNVNCPQWKSWCGRNSYVNNHCHFTCGF
jgi:C1A family cysteine protease